MQDYPRDDGSRYSSGIRQRPAAHELKERGMGSRTQMTSNLDLELEQGIEDDVFDTLILGTVEVCQWRQP